MCVFRIKKWLFFSIFTHVFSIKKSFKKLTKKWHFYSKNEHIFKHFLTLFITFSHLKVFKNLFKKWRFLAKNRAFFTQKWGFLVRFPVYNTVIYLIIVTIIILLYPKILTKMGVFA